MRAPTSRSIWPSSPTSRESRRPHAHLSIANTPHPAALHSRTTCHLHVMSIFAAPPLLVTLTVNDDPWYLPEKATACDGCPAPIEPFPGVSETPEGDAACQLSVPLPVFLTLKVSGHSPLAQNSVSCPGVTFN